MAKRLEIRVLGPLEVLDSGAAADIGGAKRQALLAMLALRQGRVVEVDALIDALWADDLPSAPRNAVHHHIARLRAALGEESIVGAADGYALADADVDAARFEELLAETRAARRDGDLSAAADAVASALALWRGPALQGLTATEWFSTEARRLDALRVDAREEEFEVTLALGEHRDLVQDLRSALAADPFRERLWGQLMLALYRSGRQAEALDVFQEARRVLSDELALEPGPELRRLQEAILSHDPSIAAPTAASRRAGNLPAPTTSFVGREDDVERVSRLLHEHRLVTLTGPPGVGKSRLAVESGRALAPLFPEGVWLVDFSGSDGREDAVRRLGNAVGVRGSDPLARAAARLRDATALVVLDACEHVLEEAARIATVLLAECPAVRVLATSREALRVPGEARMPVESLGSAAVELFLERARAARPGFEADDEEIALVTEIARRVDGLPLAIELTAARANVLGLAEIVSNLEQRSELLRAGAPSDPTRTALLELVDWSYDLLHGDEKTLLQQLAVHRGGADLASLAALGAAHGLNEATVTYLLSALVDKSVISVSFAGGAARYDMLDTVREYVTDVLASSGQIDAVRAAHAEYFASLATDAYPELRGRSWRSWETRLARENDNFWAALACASEAPDPGIASRLGTLGVYFVLGARISEGRSFLELAHAASGDAAPPELEADVLSSLCFFLTEELDASAAIAAGERALALAETTSERRLVGRAQFTLAMAYAASGDDVRGAKLEDAAAATLDSVGDDWGAAAAGVIRAGRAAAAGDAAAVASLSSLVLRHCDAIDYDAFRVPGLLLAAWVATRQGRSDEAEAAYREAFELAMRIGLEDHGAFALSELGACVSARGATAEAEELEREAIAIAEAAGVSWPAAHARVRLAQILAASGDTGGAVSLYRDVLRWAQEERRHEGREGLLTGLAGSPAHAAQAGLDAISAPA